MFWNGSRWNRSRNERSFVIGLVAELVSASLDRTGRAVTLASVVIGGLAGIALSGNVQVSGEVWQNVGLAVLAGGTVAFVVDLVLISPIRLWRRAVGENEQLRERNERLTRSALHPGFHIEGTNHITINNYIGAWSQPSAEQTTIVNGGTGTLASTASEPVTAPTEGET